jgi:hypothetical protein
MESCRKKEKNGMPENMPPLCETCETQEPIQRVMERKTKWHPVPRRGPQDAIAVS